MINKYQELYKSFKLSHLFLLFKDFIFIKNKIKRISMLNRLKDYINLSDKVSLLDIHYSLNKSLSESESNWNSYDYGEGYFYQSLKPIGITGLRDTQARLSSMGLDTLLKDKVVLEIGCNAGFLSISLSETVKSIIGFDINPYLIEMGHTVCEYLKIKNVQLETSSFEDFKANNKFDAVLSFANHSTYDGNTQFEISEYFNKIADLLNGNGIMLFESHPPSHEGNGLINICKIIESIFTINEIKVLDYGTFLDRKRTFIIASY